MGARISFLAAVCVVGLLVVPCLGASLSWRGGAAGHETEWYYADNWLPAALPDYNDTLTVLPGLALTAPDLSAYWGYDFEISGGGSLTLTGAVSATTTGFSDCMRVGGFDEVKYPGDGLLRLDGGATMYVEYILTGGTHTHKVVYVGYGGPGTLTVTDPNSKLEMRPGGGGLYVGYHESSHYGTSDGHLEVLNGGRVSTEQVLAGAGNAFAVGTVALSGNNSQLYTRTGCIIGATGTGVMTLSSSAKLQGALIVGQAATATGTVTVDNALANLWTLTVGDQGSGTLYAQNGGTVYLDPAGTEAVIGKQFGSSGSVGIIGPGTQLFSNRPLTVGALGKGSLQVTQGGSVHALCVCVNTTRPEGDSTVLVTGTDSRMDYDKYLQVCGGTLTVEKGGRLINNNLGEPSVLEADHIGGMIGSGPSGQVILRDPGTQWQGGGESALLLNPWGISSGYLTIENGAVADFGQVLIGKGGPSGEGSLTVSGTDSTLTVHGLGSNPSHSGWGGSVAVGYESLKGWLNVESGGKVVVETGDVAMPAFAGSEGIAQIDGPGSVWDIAGNLTVGAIPSGIVPLGLGTLSVSNQAGVKVGGNLTVHSGGKIWLTGGSTLTVQGEALTLENQSKFLADDYPTKGKILLEGTSLRIENQNPADVAGLANVTVVFAGGPGVTDTIEMCGSDGGDAWDAFQNNFTIGRIEIGAPGTPGHVRLADLVDNTGTPREALYVRELVVRAGSSLELLGARVYALDYINQGGNVDPGEGGLIVPLGAIGRVGAAEADVTYSPPGGDVSHGRLSISDLADVQLESSLHQEVLDGCQVLLEAFGDETGVFHDGQLTLRDPEGHPLLSAAFSLLVFECVADGLFTGSAVVEVADSAWPCALPMVYDGTMLLSLTIRQYDTPGFDGYFEGQAEVGLTPLPEPASALLLAAGAGAAWLSRQVSRRARPRRRSPLARG